jgi:ankyrin repeat protein
LVEHPMSRNMRDSFVEFLKENPNEMSDKDDLGYTMLHREAIAGNATSIEVLKEFAADVNAKTNDGKTALDFAKALNWEHLIPILSK